MSRLVDVDVDRIGLIADIEFYFLPGQLKARLRLGANRCVCDHLDTRAIVTGDANAAVDVIDFQYLRSVAWRKIQRSPYRVHLLNIEMSLRTGDTVHGNQTR